MWAVFLYLETKLFVTFLDFIDGITNLIIKTNDKAREKATKKPNTLIGPFNISPIYSLSDTAFHKITWPKTEGEQGNKITSRTNNHHHN
ncbi:hypothetical protein RB151_020740 [Providencia rettgeri]|nr:hypothetical protein RB151_020740 [Providencia rettgeri]